MKKKRYNACQVMLEKMGIIKKADDHTPYFKFLKPETDEN